MARKMSIEKDIAPVAPDTGEPRKTAASARKPKAKKPRTLAEIREAAKAAQAARAAQAAKAETGRSKSIGHSMAAPIRKQAAKRRAKASFSKRIAATISSRATKKNAEVERPAPRFPIPPEGSQVRFTKKDLDDFRRELLYMRERLSSKLSRQQSTLKRDDSINHLEEGTEAFQRFFSLECQGIDQEIIRHIDEALQAIDEGTYGICNHCGGLIQKPRLQALPFAKNCIRCQELIESHQEQRNSRR